MTEVERNKKIALDWIRAHTEGDDFSSPVKVNWDEDLSYLADDVEFWIIPGCISAGTYGREEYINFTNLARELVIGPFVITIHHVMAEGDNVHITGKGHCPLKNGKVFATEYSFLFTIENGKIKRLEEFMNTLHYNEVFNNLNVSELASA